MTTLILEPYDFGWVVGFLEGEGSFVLQKPGYNSDLRYPRISASQKFREPLDKLAALLGGKVYFVRHAGAQARRSGVEGFYCWALDGSRVAGVMLELRPWLSQRRQHQIDVCVAGELRRGPKGERNVRAKLTEADVRAIRASTLTQTALARQYGVHHESIGRVRRRESWAHVG